jgi:hypothetical protein
LIVKTQAASMTPVERLLLRHLPVIGFTIWPLGLTFQSWVGCEVLQVASHAMLGGQKLEMADTQRPFNHNCLVDES